MKTARKISSVLLTAALLMQTQGVLGFSDVSEEDAAYSDISLMNKLGIIEGVGGDLFAPDEDVSRADFLIMISKGFKIEADGEEGFDDVNPEDYYYKYVTAAVNSGVVSGRDEKHFAPKDGVTMQEAAKMCVSACELDGKAVPFSKSELAESADSWAVKWCQKASFANIIGEGFEHAKTLTRKEAARMVCAAVLYNATKRDADYKKETVIVQKRRGNIFRDTDGYPEFDVETGYPMIEYVLVDFWGNTVRHEYRKVLDGKINLKFDDIDFGHYYVNLYGTDDNQEKNKIAQTTIAYLKKFTPPPAEENPFGVNMHFGAQTDGWVDDLVNEASYIGIGTIRGSDYNWTYVEAQQGKYTNPIQSQMDLVLKNDMIFFPCTGFRNAAYENGMRPFNDVTRTGYANYVKSYYDFYGDENVRNNLTEQYNEWWGTSTVFGSPAGSTDLSYLKALYEKIRDVVKPEYPNARLAGMLANPQWMFKEGTDGTSMYDFNMNFLKEGIVDTVDELTIHFYPTYKEALVKLEFDEKGHLIDTPEKLITDGMNYLDEKMQEYNNKSLKNIPWYVTETGWYVDGKEFTERNQGTFYPRILTSFIYQGAKGIMTYDLLCDGKDPANKEHNYGILNPLLSKYGTYAARPAYVTYGVNARMIGNKKPVKREERDNVYAYEFSDGDKSVNVFNTVAYTPVTIALETDSELKITDIMGATKTFVPYNGKVYLTVNEDMLYVEGDIKSWSKIDDMVFTQKEFPAMGSDFELIADASGLGLPEEMTFEVNKKDYSKDSIIVPASYDEDERTIKVFAKINGEYVGAFDYVVEIGNKYELNTSFSLVNSENGYKPLINAKVYNRSSKDIYVNAVKYTVNGEERTQSVEMNVEPESTIDFVIEPENVLLYTNYDFTFKLITDNELSSYLDNSNKYTYVPIIKKTMTIDGVIDDDLEGIEKVNLAASYNLLDAGTNPWEGNKDLDGNIWVSYDDDNLYIAVEVTDDVHVAQKFDGDSWQSDGLQIAMFHEDYEKSDLSYDYVVSGTDTYNEMSVYLAEDMQKKLWRYNSINDIKDQSKWDSLNYEIKRNEDNKTTVYELAFPWKDLLVNPNDIKYYSVEIAVNDSDSGVRDHSYYLTGDAIVMTKNRYNYLKYTFIR